MAIGQFEFDKNISYMCETCQVLETVDHFLFHCEKYRMEIQRETEWNEQWKTFYLEKGALILHALT